MEAAAARWRRRILVADIYWIFSLSLQPRRTSREILQLGRPGRFAWPSQHKLYQDSTKFTFPKKNAQAFKVR